MVEALAFSAALVVLLTAIIIAAIRQIDGASR
jgi:hypothetical protein